MSCVRNHVKLVGLPPLQQASLLVYLIRAKTVVLVPTVLMARTRAHVQWTSRLTSPYFGALTAKPLKTTAHFSMLHVKQLREQCVLTVHAVYHGRQRTRSEAPTLPARRAIRASALWGWKARSVRLIPTSVHRVPARTVVFVETRTRTAG